MKFSLALKILLYLFSQGVLVNTENILFLLPISSKSHKNVFDPLIKVLANKGHNITVISAVKSSSLPSNVREIVPVPTEQIFEIQAKDPFETRKMSTFQRMFSGVGHFMKQCHKVYGNTEVQNVLKYDKFDLVIVKAVLNHCFFGMLPSFNASVISVLTIPASNFNTEIFGTHLPPSFSPFSFLSFSDRMSFVQRVINTSIQWLIRFLGTVYYRPMFREILQQYHGEDSPSLFDIEKNFSMLFVNSHFSINSPVPLNPDIIEIGGMHCRPSRPIEQPNLNEWLTNAKDGFIYFSLGSIIQGNKMPEEYRKIFVNVFSKLKLKVLWKWETENMTDLPQNVKLSKWLPQQDILGHPNIRMFITHGGLLSTQEAVFHGVPIIGFPFFSDQDLNMANSENLGFAKKLEILELSEDILENAINTMLSNPKYTKRATELSKIFRDQPSTPLERAVFWVEYVIRHKGADQLRPSSRDLHLFQYHSYDVILFLVTICILIFFILKTVTCLIVSKTCRKSLIIERKND